MRSLLIAATAGALTVTGVGTVHAADNVTVMTRNIFLGADLGPALRATDTNSFIAAAGEIFRQLESTNFPRRAKGLADEIQQRKPDVIGLQEAALWRRGPVNIGAITGKPAATEVYQDFVKILLKRVNKGPAKYEVVKIHNEFDFEAPADIDNDPKTGLLGADADFRLTMRDVILKRSGVGIKTKDVRTGQYTKKNSFSATVGPVTVTSIRGWLSTRVKKKDGPWFTFANTHLEAFDDRTQVPSIRAKQAKEFAKAMAKVKGPLIALGDFNSDSPGLVPGDEQAFEALMSAGFKDIGTTKPMSCCIAGSDDLKTGGSIDDFDHRVDQIFTTTPKKVKKLKTWVVGREQSYGFWHSDHAGVVGKYALK
ncbi:MAG: endonuclease/exonuclease/phosphatase family protein [Candidatus Nanopelagicales bacterium]|nr:endonuclease/exonuclease/phosphatase family protein [Candidatus Nanopelagicales bacterium]